jgi:hypothetical protein
MVMMWSLLPRVSLRMLNKLPRVKLKLAPRKKTSKLTLMLKELRCEGMVFIALEHIFCKDFLAHLRHHRFHDMEQVSL